MRVQSIQTNYVAARYIKMKKSCSFASKKSDIAFKGILPKGINIWDLAIAGIIGSATGGIGGIAYLAGKKAIYEIDKQNDSSNNDGNKPEDNSKNNPRNHGT